MYADDIILISDSPKGLQQLDTVHNWSTRWQLSSYTDKTKVIHFRRASDPISTFNFKLGDNNIGLLNSYKYLGLELNENLDYSDSAQILSDAGSCALGALTFKNIKTQGLHFDTYTQLYNSTVTPVVDYAAAVWASKTYAFLKMSNINFLRYREKVTPTSYRWRHGLDPSPYTPTERIRSILYTFV